MWLDTFNKVLLLIPTAFGAHIDLASIATPNATFQAPRALVDNWRVQAFSNLDMPLETKVPLLLGSRNAATPRCVRLNNYWCIKRGGWDGELGFDREGHVAFSSASAGARAAVILLRRYYLDFGRKTAMEIVSHWAPNGCRPNVAVRRSPAPAVAVRAPALPDWRTLSPEQRTVAFNRMRAKNVKAGEAQFRQRLQFIRAVNAGLVRPRVAEAKRPPSASQPVVAPIKAAPPVAAISCADEERRIAAYARASIQGIARGPNDDLQLFASNGRPSWHLTRMMLNMAAIEIGPQKVEETLITNVVAAFDLEAQKTAE